MFMHNRFLRAMAILICLALIPLTTCGKDSPTRPQAPEPTPPPPPAPVATRIEISPSSASLTSIGQTVQLTAGVFDQNNAQMSSAVVAWTSSDDAVATVSGQGLVTAVKNGTATITGRSGSASATSTVTVMQSVGSIAIEPTSATLMSLGETVQLTATVFDQRNQQVTNAVVTWSSSDDAVATVSGQGLVTAVKNGTATITGRSGSASATSSVTVKDDSRDREALVALYNSTNGPNWTNSTNWLSVAPLDQWHGVSTDADGRVVGLSLSRNNLRGTIPAEIGKLVRLGSLSLGYNGLLGTIPPQLGSLALLTQLNLENNALSGPIPPELGGLRRLDLLNIHANSLTGSISPELGDLAALRYLILAYNNLKGPIPSVLGELDQLQVLHLGDNQLTGPIPPELGNLETLQRLDLVSNQLRGPIPPELGQLAQLRSLNLGDNQLTGPIPPSLGNLSELTSLLLFLKGMVGRHPSPFWV